MKSVLPSSKLDAWLKHNLNVMLIGKHGVGKTEKIRAAVKRNGIKNALYFSCATLDPWVDFIGIPKEKTKNGVTYLTMVRPKAFAFDEVEFIFLDELNRAKPAIQNALLELILSSSINGHKLKNLRCIWVAINPPPKKHTDTQYHVEELDPAMMTRFPIRFNVPFDLDKDFFDKKHGKGIYEKLHPWWTGLPEDLKDEFPPRSVDMTLDVLSLGLDIADSLPERIHKNHFMKALNSAPGTDPTNPIGSGVSIQEVFATIDPTQLRSIIRKNAGNLTPLIQALSNEELIKLVKSAGLADNTTGALNTTGKRIVEAISEEQKEAIGKLRSLPKLKAAASNVSVQKAASAGKVRKKGAIGGFPLNGDVDGSDTDPDEDDSGSDLVADDGDDIDSGIISRPTRRSRF